MGSLIVAMKEPSMAGTETMIFLQRGGEAKGIRKASDGQLGRMMEKGREPDLVCAGRPVSQL